jgi:hypothetical protein
MSEGTKKRSARYEFRRCTKSGNAR